jgi:hypothetical protein
MKIIQAFAEAEEAITQVEVTLARITAKSSEDHTPNVITAADLEAINQQVKVAADFIRSMKSDPERIKQSLQLEDAIVNALDKMENPYAESILIYSTENLKQYDEYTCATIKRSLSDYFSAKGMPVYEGWN